MILSQVASLIDEYKQGVSFSPARHKLEGWLSALNYSNDGLCLHTLAVHGYIEILGKKTSLSKTLERMQEEIRDNDETIAAIREVLG